MMRVAFLCGLVFVAGLAACNGAEEPDRPNTVLIISDDQGWTDYGFMGHGQIQTPRIDRLASEVLIDKGGKCPE